MPVKTPSFLPNDLVISEGTILGNSYKVEAFLGQGIFGFVTKCLNTKTNKAVAIKVSKNDPEIQEQAKLELFIHKQLRCLDPDSCNIVKWNGCFLDRERICLNFELLDQSLYDYMEDRSFQALSVSELRPVLHQLANALSHLSSMGIVHTDLKPDNMMVVDRHQSPLKVKIINFGLARPVSSLFSGLTVQPLGYRAPEVMIYAPFNQTIDMWSLGLIAAELAMGCLLYPGDSEFDVLRCIIHTQGQPPDSVLDRGFCTDYFFIQENSGNQRWRFKSVQQFEYETGDRVQEIQFSKLNSLDDLEEFMKMRTGHHSGQALLVSLIKQMLHLDANQRITPLEVLGHSFFDQGLDPRTDIEDTEEKSLVLSQQPYRCQSKSPHSINCSVQNPAELPKQTTFNMPVNTPSFLSNDLDISEGTILGNSYKVEAFLGQGIFGFVTKCLNTKTNKAVAIKVSKIDPEIQEQAKLELFIHEQLRCLDPDSCNIVKWNGCFLDGERICLNFELLDQSLYDYMEDRSFQALSVSELRPVLHQLANALSHLSSMGIVHTDLKPDNMMVVDRHQSPLIVKMINFGLARPVSSLFSGLTVQPLGYRAPEVMIYAPFNQAIDMWSLGLIAAELAIGCLLYRGDSEFDVLRYIIHTQGQPPDSVLDRGFCTDYFFIQENSGNQRWRFKSVQQFEYETGDRVQETQFAKLNSLDDLEEFMKMRTGHHSGQALLVSLIKQMLHLDANQRITPLEVLGHSFFDQGLDPRTDIEDTEEKSLVLSQQPSRCQSKSPHSINCSVQNPAELPKQTTFNMPVNAPSFLSNDLDISEGTILGNSYKVEAFLGQGIFGFVTKCLNTKTNKTVAIKVSKNDPEIQEQAKLELFIHEQLRCLDPDSCNIVKWNGCFLDRERICLNFELLDQSLYDYMEDRSFQALSVSELRPVLHQLANALSHLSSMGIVHTDLKPDNLMVVDRHQSPLKVKIIDFGLARPVSSLFSGLTVQPLGYRAPEVMIYAPFNQAIDMWSLGLIAAELAMGCLLYPGDSEFDVLRCIIHTQGQPPDSVLDRGFCTDYFFIQENSGNQRWRFKSVQQLEYETRDQVQETQFAKLNSLDDLEEFMKMRTGHHSGQALLVSLIKQMLHLDANQRITPLEVLGHPFFDQGLDPRTDIEDTEEKSLVPSQQPYRCQSKSPHSINCSVQNPAELPKQTTFNMPVNTPSFLSNDLDISEGTILRNKVEAFLGQGIFGFVTKCLNMKTNKAVAIKVNKMPTSASRPWRFSGIPSLTPASALVHRGHRRVKTRSLSSLPNGNQRAHTTVSKTQLNT